MVNVLDPAVHRKSDATVKAVSFVNGRAEIPTDSAILDTLRIERPAVEGKAQTAEVRADGPAGDEPSFGYAAAYKAAGATFEDGVIGYDPTGTIAPELYHGDYAYIGIAFPAPDGATGMRADHRRRLAGARRPVDRRRQRVQGRPARVLRLRRRRGWRARPRVVGGPHLVDRPATRTAPRPPCRVSRGTDAYVEGADYALDYNANAGAVVLSSIDGRISDGAAKVTYTEMDPSAVDADDIVEW